MGPIRLSGGGIGEADRKLSIRRDYCAVGGIALVPVTAQIEGIEWIVILILMAIVFVLFLRFVVQLVARTNTREVVKVRCRRCGALNAETDRFCGSCGAPL